MKLIKPLNGFTLTEVLITMIISGILISCLFLFYTNASRFIHSLIEKEQLFSEVMRFQVELENDIQKCHLLKRVGDSAIELENEDTLLRYILSSKKIIRIQSDFIDTFRFGINYFSFIQNTFDTDADVLPAGEIRLGIQTVSFQDTISFVKRYSAEEMIGIKREL